MSMSGLGKKSRFLRNLPNCDKLDTLLLFVEDPGEPGAVAAAGGEELPPAPPGHKSQDVPVRLRDHQNHRTYFLLL